MTGAEPAPGATATDEDTAELINQLRQLAGADPADVRQVVAEVLTTLDRAAGGALREQLPAAIRLDAGLDAGVPGQPGRLGGAGPVTHP